MLRFELLFGFSKFLSEAAFHSRRKRMKINAICTLAAITCLATCLAFSQTNWQKYPGNPVLTPTQAWESGGIISPRMLKEGNTYKMWYTGFGSNWQIGLATSEDGINWTKWAGNPVLRVGNPGDFDSQHTYTGIVLFHNGKYWMWYSGHNGVKWQIGLATSPDGIQWTKDPNNPVLRVGNPGAWDETHVYAPSVVFDGLAFRMWHNGVSPSVEGASGYAISPDGIHWEKHPASPVLAPLPNSWESRAVGLNVPIYENGVFHGWYGGRDQDFGTKIGYATSTDGVNWQRYPYNPVITLGDNGGWDDLGLGGLWVLHENTGYKMWYSGYSSTWQIGYAESIPSGQPCSGIPLPAAEAYGYLRNQDQSHADKVTYCFPGQTGDKYLTFEVFDIDRPGEVDLLLNGVHLLNVPVTANNGWSSVIGVLLSEAQLHDNQSNELVFDNTQNPPNSWRWGVRRVAVEPYYALPAPAAYGKIRGGDQTHADKVVYFFSGQAGDMNVQFEAYDIDQYHEVEVLLNGAKIHDVAVTPNESWSTARTLALPDDRVYDNAINVLIFENTQNPPRAWFWGVRNVSVAATPASSITINPTVTMSVSGSGLQDSQYLVDGRSTPLARPLGDAGAPTDPGSYVIEGATTISPNGYAIVEFPSAQRFDYLTLYPEWHANRYFSYRVETSVDGNNWRTVIDNSETFRHGAQLVSMPNTSARFVRLAGTSCVINVDSLQALNLSEEAYWQAHETLLQQAVLEDLALAEVAFIQTRPTVGVKEPVATLPAAFQLAQNLPNPFNPSTQIRFDLPAAGQVQLAVYNLRGELVRTLVSGELPAGTHAFTFDGSGLASGVYLYRLQAEGYTAVRKMLLAK
jgi:predicted GH43/DUF377 family glycosyl hydrolase